MKPRKHEQRSVVPQYNEESSKSQSQSNTSNQHKLRPFFFSNCVDTKLSRDQLKAAEEAIRSLCDNFEKIDSEEKCMNVARWPNSPPGQADNDMKRGIVLRRIKAGGDQNKTTVVYARIGNSLNVFSVTAGHDGEYLDNIDFNTRINKTLKDRHNIPQDWLEPNSKTTYAELENRSSSNFLQPRIVENLFKDEQGFGDKGGFQSGLKKILSENAYKKLKTDANSIKILIDCINKRHGRREYVEDVGQNSLKRYNDIDELIKDLQQYFPEVRKNNSKKR